MKIMFKNNNGRKRMKCDTNTHKAMIVLDGIFQTNNKLFVTVLPKIACKLKCSNRLWLPFLDQTRSEIVVFGMITFQIYTTLLTKWKHGIGHNDINIFNEEL